MAHKTTSVDISASTLNGSRDALLAGVAALWASETGSSQLGVDTCATMDFGTFQVAITEGNLTEINARIMNLYAALNSSVGTQPISGSATLALEYF